MYFLQITPDQAYSNYQESLILQEVHFLFQDDQELEITNELLLNLPFADIDDIELCHTLFYAEKSYELRIYRPTKESIIIGMVQANLQGAQINFGPYLGYNRQAQPPLPQHRPQQQQPQQKQQQIPRIQRAGAG